MFIAYMHDSKVSASYITSSISALGHLHKMAGLEDVTKNFMVLKAMAGARKVSPSRDTRLPITRNMLKELVQALPQVFEKRSEAVLYQSMFVTAFCGFFRIGELTPKTKKDAKSVVQLSDVHWQADMSEAIISIRQFKHSAKHGPQQLVLRKEARSNADVCPVRNLRRFLNSRGKSVGPLFMLDGQMCLRRKFDEALKATLCFCKYSTSAYKGHSFRIGAATDAAAKGLSDAQIRTLGRWNSDAFRRYIRLSGLHNKFSKH